MLKTVWIEAYSRHGYDHLVDGHRLAADTDSALNQLDADGFEIVSIVPVVSGRYDFQKFDSRVNKQLFSSNPTVSPDTCASWGFSMTDGVMIVAKRAR